MLDNKIKRPNAKPTVLMTEGAGKSGDSFLSASLVASLSAWGGQGLMMCGNRTRPNSIPIPPPASGARQYCGQWLWIARISFPKKLFHDEVGAGGEGIPGAFAETEALLSIPGSKPFRNISHSKGRTSCSIGCADFRCGL